MLGGWALGSSAEAWEAELFPRLAGVLKDTGGTEMV